MSTASDTIDTKGLLQRVEKAGGIRRVSQNFKLLCDADVFFFGPRVSKKDGIPDTRRRRYQIAFDNLRRRSIQSYIGLCKTHGVQPHPDTTAKLEGKVEWADVD